MSEEEIIKYTKNIINATYIEATEQDEDGNIIEQGLVNQQVIQGLLDLYNKEKNKELENADLTTVYMNGFYEGDNNLLTKDEALQDSELTSKALSNYRKAKGIKQEIDVESLKNNSDEAKAMVDNSFEEVSKSGRSL